jgi:hypothetical protein
VATESHEAQLAWERRFAPYAAAAAFGAVLLDFASTVAQLPILRHAPSRDADKRYRESLLSFHDHTAAYLAYPLIAAGATVLAAAALFYLFRATRHRRPELPPFLQWLLVVGPLFLIVAAIANHMNLHDVADKFLASSDHSNKHAKQVIDDNQNTVGGGLGLAGALAMALSFVLIGLNAMRAGLLSRFMGILGILVGVLVVLPLLPSPIPVVQVFWLAALGFLVLGRWPGGRGPAWESGEADPWPTPQARAGVAAGGRRGSPEPEPEPEAEERPPRASRKRKKRKRR